MDVGTYDDDKLQVVGVKCAKEVGASKPSPIKHRRRSPSSQKPSTKKTSHERSPHPWNKGISIGGDGGDEEDGETEDQKKKRRQEEHQGKEITLVQTTPMKEVKKINKGQLLV